MTATARAIALSCALGVGASGFAPAAQAQAVAGAVFFVANNIRADVRCSLWERGRWSPPFTLRGGAGWSAPAAGRADLYIRCEAPADAKPYRIVPGQRYSILRDRSGRASIYKITAG